MVNYKDERFEYVFEMLCEKTVEVEEYDRQIKAISHVIYDLEKQDNEHYKDMKSLEELRSKLVGLRARKDKVRRDFDYYFGLFTTSIANKSDEALTKSVEVFTKKEDELRTQLAELVSNHGDAEEISRLKEKVKAYYNYIETIYAFIDEHNTLSSKHRRPM